MAKVSGFGTAFNSATFRTAIKNTMKMGSPTKTEEKVTFKWTTVTTYAKADSAGKAWKKDAAVVSTVTHADVLVDCAVEFLARTTLSSGTPVGHFDTPRVIITLLDVDFALVDGADHVSLGGNDYKIDFVAPPVALFDVDVYSVYASAVDEV